MTGTSSNRWAVAVVAVIALVVRAFPFFGPDGAWSYRVDYDEGVYFSAASHLLSGHWPYRDFVFAHPPGVLIFLATTSAWMQGFLGVDGAFAVSRWIAAIIGTLNVLLIARLVRHVSGQHLAALFAAALYAVYPEVVQVERGPFLEPVLNLVCLSMVLCLQLASEAGSTYRPAWVLIAGVLGGVAISIKLWAVLWLFGALAGLLLLGERRMFITFIVAVVLTAAALVLPFALRAPSNFVTQVGLFHLWRPPDGIVSKFARVEQIVALRHLASPLLALGLLVITLRRRETSSVVDRVVLIAWTLTLAGFFASSAYWSQYNAHLIASEAVLAGLAFAMVSQTRLSAALAGLIALSLGLSVFHVIRRSESTDEHLRLARSELRTTPECVFTFEPGWSLAAGRLPPPALVDSYADQLLASLSGGARFPSSAEAFAANVDAPTAVTECRHVILGDRGRRQLSLRALEQFEAKRQRRETAGLEVWDQL